MGQILIVYTTSIGNTKKMAEAVAAGTKSVAGADVTLIEAEAAIADRDALEQTKEMARRADAIVLGSPVRHRSADSRVKRFIEEVIETLWLTDDLVGKVGGVFTVGGGYGNTGAGVEITQLGMLAALAGVGMILVTLPKTTPGAEVAGSHWGAHGRSGGARMEPVGISVEMMECAYHHGANIARVASELKNKDLLARGNVAPSPELVKMFLGTGDSGAGEKQEEDKQL